MTNSRIVPHMKQFNQTEVCLIMLVLKSHLRFSF